MRLLTPENIALASGCTYAWWWARNAPRREKFPTELWVDDPPVTDEGVFEIGHYLPDAGEPCLWAPWDGGEQHLGIFGTTGSGKTVTARVLAATAFENWGWDTVAIDGAKDGLDFAFMDDSKIGRVIRAEEIATELTAIADEVERRARAFHKIRVPRKDRKGVKRAVVPPNLRFLTPAERERYGFKPMVVIIDEAAIMLAREKSTPAPPARRSRKKKADEEETPEPVTSRNPIELAMLRIAAAGRFAGIHLVCIMQRGDADLLKGFIGNLLRARVLVGSTDQTAEAMAHGASTMNVWQEVMGAEGWEPDGMERALRPPGRAFVSGLAPRLPGLVQLYRFDSDSRFRRWTDDDARGGWDPDDPPPSSPPDDPSGPDGPPAGPPERPLSLVPGSVRGPDYAPRSRAVGPGANPVPDRHRRTRLRVL